MKALTLWQPWATLMASGLKRNETRGWSTPHRGPLAIHASTRTTGWGRRGTMTPVGPFWVERDRDGLFLHSFLSDPVRLPLGAVVAIVSVVDVTRTDELEVPPLERMLGDYSPGRWAWQTDSLQTLTDPVPAKGAQQLWDWDPS